VSQLYLLPLPLEQIMMDIKRSLAAHLYYPALLIALTIPDICMSLMYDVRKSVKENHYAWFVDKYTTESALGVSGSACYRTRCGIVHRANVTGNSKSQWTGVIFTIPESRAMMHAFSIQNQAGRAAMLDLVTFCDEIIVAARRWHRDNMTNPQVASNMDLLITFRPNGLPPFLGGIPVVASGS
jgi:hypothetical protein